MADETERDPERPAGGVFTVDGFDDDPDDIDDEYGQLPVESSPMRRGLIITAVVLVVVGGLAFLGWRWVRTQIDGTGVSDETQVVVIEQGATVSEVAELLEGNDIIGNGTVFRVWLAATQDSDPVFQAGEYVLNTGQSYQGALDQIGEGPRPPELTRITIPEGLRVSQVLERITAQVPGLSATGLTQVATDGEARSFFQPADQPSLEGFLFPETYRFDPDQATPESIIEMLVDQFDEVATDVDLGEAEPRVGITPYETLIVASLIEKETGSDEERAKVARVIYNRLAQDIPLGIDASLIYVIGPLRQFFGQKSPEDDPTLGLTESELDYDSPYNLRENTGLPPTPIASPGRASLEAALAPAEGDWIYYVLADCDGTHLFTADAAEFERQKSESASAGILDGSAC